MVSVIDGGGSGHPVTNGSQKREQRDDERGALREQAMRSRAVANVDAGPELRPRQRRRRV
jgi:hypothetical protein